MEAVEHEHAEIAGAHGDRSAANRLAASAAWLRSNLDAFSAILGVCVLDVVDIQCVIGGASGASGGLLGLLNPNGMTSGLLLCARAC